jgi:hypothetical protein
MGQPLSPKEGDTDNRVWFWLIVGGLVSQQEPFGRQYLAFIRQVADADRTARVVDEQRRHGRRELRPFSCRMSGALRMHAFFMSLPSPMNL